MINPDCQDLTSDSDYQTPPGGRRSIWDRLLRPFNIHFYVRSFYHIWRLARKCKNGPIDPVALRGCCGRVLRAAERSGAMVSIEGTGKIGEGPRVFIGNHMSTLETLTLAYILRRTGNVTFVIKEDLLKYPFFGDIMRSMKCIPMTRTDPRKDLKSLMTMGLEHLKQGTSVVVFPQKTRARQFDAQEFNSIGVKLAKRAGVPVQPLALETSFWGRGKIISDYGPITRSRPVRFALAEEIHFEGKSDKEIHQACIDFIEEKLISWNGELSPES